MISGVAALQPQAALRRVSTALQPCTKLKPQASSYGRFKLLDLGEGSSRKPVLRTWSVMLLVCHFTSDGPVGSLEPILAKVSISNDYVRRNSSLQIRQLHCY